MWNTVPSLRYFACWAVLITLALAGGSSCSSRPEIGPEAPGANGNDLTDEPDEESDATPDNQLGENGLLVAFIGDQGLGENAEAVLELIHEEEAGLVLHQGDLDYDEDPEAWDAQINQTLGEDFPYVASVGNHDKDAWGGYQTVLQSRIDRIAGLTCEGNLGINSRCTFQGLLILLSGVGTLGEGHAEYLQTQLDNTEAVWKICSWHKNQRLMQVGGKSNETGWEVYDICRRGGAIIATGHEHSYSRTHLMSSFENQTIASADNTLNIRQGETFAFVSGLAGASIRDQDEELAAHPWWASIYTKDQDAKYGALFCRFGVAGVSENGSCYFKDIDGNTPDTFDLVSHLSEAE